MTAPTEPRFLVDPDSDPIVIRIEGRASFKNCSCVKDFLTRMIDEGKRRFVMDFQACSGMDSTYLGVLAGAALQLRKTEPRGSLVVCNLGERNLELLHNLGLNRLLTIDNGPATVAAAASADGEILECTPVTDEVAAARMVLDAHKDLVAADAGNEVKFRDVLSFLKQRLGEE